MSVLTSLKELLETQHFLPDKAGLVLHNMRQLIQKVSDFETTNVGCQLCLLSVANQEQPLVYASNPELFMMGPLSPQA